ncbi:MAG TPA: GTP cyclohydrolase I FolE [Acidobacteriota bacterium]|jgi:GTP cyclohydrolase I
MPGKLPEIEVETTSSEIEGMLQKIILFLGEDPFRDGLRDTPRRMAESLKFLTSGYQVEPMDLVRGALFEVSYNEMVIVKDIELFSLCEHHLLPFFGKCHVAYIPNGQVIGLSKIPRLVDAFARRLQIQERLTTQIAETISDVVQPRGVAVVVEAVHLCMIMRGVEKQNSIAVTSSMLGTFKEHIETRNEFLSLIHQPRP